MLIRFVNYNCICSILFFIGQSGHESDGIHRTKTCSQLPALVMWYLSVYHIGCDVLGRCWESRLIHSSVLSECLWSHDCLLFDRFCWGKLRNCSRCVESQCLRVLLHWRVIVLRVYLPECIDEQGLQYVWLLKWMAANPISDSVIKRKPFLHEQKNREVY